LKKMTRARLLFEGFGKGGTMRREERRMAIDANARRTAATSPRTVDLDAIGIIAPPLLLTPELGRLFRARVRAAEAARADAGSGVLTRGHGSRDITRQ
jgi:hypothetical protein